MYIKVGDNTINFFVPPEHELKKFKGIKGIHVEVLPLKLITTKCLDMKRKIYAEVVFHPFKCIRSCLLVLKELLFLKTIRMPLLSYREINGEPKIEVADGVHRIFMFYNLLYAEYPETETDLKKIHHGYSEYMVADEEYKPVDIPFLILSDKNALNALNLMPDGGWI